MRENRFSIDLLVSFALFEADGVQDSIFFQPLLLKRVSSMPFARRLTISLEGLYL
jgi:hypothetical protein